MTTDARTNAPGGTEVRPRTRRLLPLAGKLLLVFAALAFVVLVMEAGLRLVVRFPPPLFRADPVLGTTFRPDFDDTVFVEESGRTVRLQFNSLGFRDREWSVEKPQGTRRIAVIGDSMIASIATDVDDTLARRLERLLADDPAGVRHEVMNFGVSGSSTAQELKLYESLVRRYRPDMVVCAFCVWNDLADNDNRLTASGNRIYFELDEDGVLRELPRSGGKSRASNWLNDHSRLYVWQKHLTAKLKDRTTASGGGVQPSKMVFCREPPERIERAWRLTEALLTRFIDAVREDGGTFVLALMPSADQVYRERWDALVSQAEKAGIRLEPDAPQRRLAEFCRRRDVGFVPIVDEFRDFASQGTVGATDEWLHFGASGHFNEAGNRVAAEALADRLLR
jgi:lysophospholipase L1-like esterase